MTGSGVIDAGVAGAAGRRGPGRPRREGVDERLIAAALELIDAGLPVTAAQLVARSGVGRAAIYRRWPSLTELVATALDEGRSTHAIPTDGDLRQALYDSFIGTVERGPAGYPEQRMRRRLILGLEDRHLQRAYWEAHVVRRRVSTIAALRAGVERGILRGDLDLEACADLLSGVFYYQLVVRGAPLTEPEAIARCRAAIDVIWRGMLPDGAA
ncbi:TetR/AcrR family transcriptional regulator C-terminal ligand-binding domain-containing protein [Microbacterium sp.]|uniref:TetR/AcrR family transcriptional regulator n=1 Tax=Microbacterium sp. TaxID=51671 RepID=UPI002811CE3C|nr:TetR/AcrR family transcriptional regulator C-terminal ligand-binding domain-containing protein [Microbacterium sp.]